MDTDDAIIPYGRSIVLIKRTYEQAVVIGAKEETGLDVKVVKKTGVYDNSTSHTFFENSPKLLAFDHSKILKDVGVWK